MYDPNDPRVDELDFDDYGDTDPDQLDLFGDDEDDA